MYILLQEDTVEYYTSEALLYQDIIDNELVNFQVLKRMLKTELWRDITDDVMPRTGYMAHCQKEDQKHYDAAQCLPGVI